MKYRILGKTGLTVSVVGVGTWQFGGEWGKTFTQRDVDEIVGTAADCGINFIDTAECYGDHLSESLIGTAIAKSRCAWIIATKYGHHFHGHNNRSRHFDAADVSRQLDASLAALGTDYIDLYQFHSGTDEEFDNDGLWEFLLRQVQAGTVRHLGVSLSAGTKGTRQVDAAPQRSIAAVQVVHNRLQTTLSDKVLPLCRRLNLGVLARAPLASGFLSGKYRENTAFAPNDVRSSHEPAQRAALIEEARRIGREEAPAGVDMAQWAIAWSLKNPAVSVAIPGCKSAAQVRSNAAAAELLDAD
jgi:aryl-alcohol dehydrogenase-like predicted oxidoreductase